jgi:hypothetical protein
MRQVLIALAMFLALGGCSDEKHYERTALDEWVTRQLPSIGATIETPKDIAPYWIKEYENRAYISMHVLGPPLMGDAQPLVKLEIERIGESALVDQFPKSSLAYQRADAAGRARLDALFNTKQLKTVRIGGDTGYIWFRRDVPCPNGELLSAKVGWNADVSHDGRDHRVDDAAAIERMLDSLQALR